MNCLRSRARASWISLCKMINDFLIKISGHNIKQEEVKDIQQLKKDSDQLEDIEKLITQFNKLMFRPIKNNTNKDQLCLQKINLVDRKKINCSIKRLDKLLGLINEKQLVNVNLIGLAHYLAELKVTFLTKDREKAEKIIKTFVNRRNWNLIDLSIEIKMLSNFIKDFHKEHDKFTDLLFDSLNEKDFLRLKIKEQNNIIKKLNETAILQKNLFYQIKIVFIDLMNKLLKDDSIGDYIDVRSMF